MAAAAGRLQGLVSVITGAASGIGRSTAKKFVENGAKVSVLTVPLSFRMYFQH